MDCNVATTGLEQESSSRATEGSVLLTRNKTNYCDKRSGGQPGELQALIDVTSSNPIEIRGCGCKSAFCDDCALPNGLKIRDRLKTQMKNWEKIIMLTLTIDPKEFESFQDSFEYVSANRCISRLMREMKRLGHMNGEWFQVLEFQQSGNPHWHILIRTDWIPVEELTRVWHSYGPAGTLGFVKISKRDFVNPEHAVNYATKYVLKAPKYGWPEWVLNAVYRIRRYSCSRGLLGWARRSKTPPKKRYKIQLRTIAQRIAQCKTTVVALTRGVEAATGKIRRRFFRKWLIDWTEVATRFNIKGNYCNITQAEFEKLEKRMAADC